jgi:transcription elongation GreA/GreB family factor
LANLKRFVANAIPIEYMPQYVNRQPGQVWLGCSVALLDESQHPPETERYILGNLRERDSLKILCQEVCACHGEDAELASCLSDVTSALLGRFEGEMVELRAPNGIRRCKILAVTPLLG